MAFDKPRNGKTGAGGFHRQRIRTADGLHEIFALQPLNETRIIYPVTAENTIPEGEVLLPRWKEWDDDDPALREMRWSRYPDIFSAIRGTLHAMLGYDPERGAMRLGEVGKMEEGRDVAQGALAFMREVRDLTPESAKVLTQRFLKLIEILDGSRLLKKRQALEQFGNALVLRDSQGRRNIGALMARTVAGIARLNGRVDDIRSIGPRLALQLMMLEQELSLMFRALERIELALGDVLRLPAAFDLPLRNLRLVEHVQSDMKRMAQIAKVFKAQPFVDLGRRLSVQLVAAGLALQEARGEDARLAIERARQDLVVPMIERTELGAIHRDLSLLTDGKLPPEMQGEIDNRLGRFNVRLPELKGVPGFPYDAARGAASEARRALRQGSLADAKRNVARLVGALELAFRLAPPLPTSQSAAAAQ